MSEQAPRKAEARPDKMIGALVGGKYRVLSLIAAGGMGKIYRAEQQPLGRIVALKLLHITTQRDPTAAETSDADVSGKRFFREASILAKLQHPNIVTVFDFGAVDTLSGATKDDTAENQFFMAMEFLQGETLHERLLHQRRLSWEDTVRFTRQIARGLREAHALGIVHRDLKPMNLMITTDRDGEEQIKILDFGIVKMIDEPQKELTQEGAFVGSPMYMAPEQIETGRVDLRSDIYSLGIVVYRCLCGAPPFSAGGSMKIMMSHLSEAPPPLGERVPDLPQWVESVVMRCLQKSPSERPQTMDELLRLLSDPNVYGSGLQSSGEISALRDRPPSNPGSGPRSSSMLPALAPAPTLPPEAPTIAGGASTSMRPAEPTAPKRSPLPFVLAGVAALALIAVILLLQRGRSTVDEGKTGAASTTAPKDDLPKSFTFTIDSSPRGADVFEGDRLLGQTPFSTSIDAAAVAKDPRAFTLRKEGYEAYSIVQGPSHEAVRVVAPLVKEAEKAPPEPSTIEPPKTPTPSSTKIVIAKNPPTASTTAKPPPPPPPLDIQLKR